MITALPAAYQEIETATRQSGFSMASDVLTCTLLRTLAGTKPGGRFLELGTGTGLATSWILDGMDARASLVSVDHDASLLAIARNFTRTTFTDPPPPQTVHSAAAAPVRAPRRQVAAIL
ncbi:O-methyltransferase [Chitinophaga japonensis]|uniref:hypothetical protein n=1 Tax=Chitinophaga japonensis TaxID=104662 RepID=UPI0011A40C33|nr:hypothetical protein [Chitinophaga japonensis]